MARPWWRVNCNVNHSITIVPYSVVDYDPYRHDDVEFKVLDRFGIYLRLFLRDGRFGERKLRRRKFANTNESKRKLAR